jgi:hypothetical protein
LHSTNWSNGEKKKRRKETILLKKPNSLEDLVGNEENRYPVPDSKKIMTNVTNEHQ